MGIACETYGVSIQIRCIKSRLIPYNSIVSTIFVQDKHYNEITSFFSRIISEFQNKWFKNQPICLDPFSLKYFPI